jgi:dTDP-4-dehydrorhamnose 3,5-epimerase
VTLEGLPGVRLDALEQHADARGRFVELFRANAFPEVFVQGNHSRSRAGVLRGLHYHHRQADLWYVVSGIAQVALVDLRRRADAPRVATLELDGSEPATLYIPPLVAHGFLALTDVELMYLVTAYYDARDEHGVAWNDPALAVPWKSGEPMLSERDAANQPLRWEDIPASS